ncbi:nitric oxide synthase [Apiospora saccharicola]|uniref:nitric-oxide synthase (NADPH) n=1 Tax=Apiospora saccharicola TaxID=335842 RepID=A0ABR1TKW0_9PEZI
MMSPSCPFLSSAGRSSCNIPDEKIKVSPQDEFSRIKKAYPSLASTGCNAKFCQSGRMKHTDEERVGRNQPVDAVKQDATDFLYQLRDGGIIKSEQDFNKRLAEALEEVELSSTTARYLSCTANGSDATGAKCTGRVGGNWTQTSEELEFGIRQAWKHSRRCIMRSEYKDLRLCDLRYVKTSSGMALELIDALKAAFNNGEIRPTVFVFPPRGPNERGPMIWNSNLLSFAGYEEGGGRILGDPQNVSLTNAIIELGWQPPPIRTQWDLLPIVTMAQGDEPVITELSETDFPIVHIRHPHHQLAFDRLGLRWTAAPALSRLGFTIGGVQYTATPFIGWFMDAEIGVRNLADSFRYNVLPDIIRSMGLAQGDLDALPDYERLALLSRAQLELNYAVTASFARAKVRIIDSLSASELYTNFDDEHLAEHGYRLPADPYWLAPPQGSIIPIWHRGASPNYQPKPMICHHAQDPIKAWRRESGQRDVAISETTSLSMKLTLQPSTPPSPRRIFIHYCSSGTVAAKLARKLFKDLTHVAGLSPTTGTIMPVQTLDSLTKARPAPEDVIVIVASNTRKGEMPLNGTAFLRAIQEGQFQTSSPFAIFGNGSKDYADTFCQTAVDLECHLASQGCSPLVVPVHTDTVVENPPWTAFNHFSKQVIAALQGNPQETLVVQQETANLLQATAPTLDTSKWIKASVQELQRGDSDTSMRLVCLDLRGHHYPSMSYISIFPPNDEATVRSLLNSIKIRADERVQFAGNIRTDEFFRFYADFQQPFRSMSWASDLADVKRTHSQLDLKQMSVLPVCEVMARLPADWRYWASLEDLCSAVPRIRPRIYSAASHPDYCNDSKSSYSTAKKAAAAAGIANNSRASLAELLVQHHAAGAFSDRFLNNLSPVAARNTVACRIEKQSHLEAVADAVYRPLILFATGSGLAPMRCLLQHRARLLKRQSQSNGAAAGAVPQPQHAPISLFLGHRAEDEALVQESLAEARTLGLFDVLKVVRSNPQKRRAQDAVFDDVDDENNNGAYLQQRRQLVAKIKTGGALVFACAKVQAEQGFLDNLTALLGRDAREALGERYVADVYQPAI